MMRPFNVVRLMAIVLAAVAHASVDVGSQAMFDRERTQRQPRATSWMAEKTNRLPLEVPRTPWGEPDLRGFYNAEGISSDNVEQIDDWLDPATPPTETFIVEPADGRIPYQPWALAERNRFRAGLSRGWPGETGERLYIDPQTYCFTGIPRITWRGLYQVKQTPGYVFVVLNWGHFYRVIPTDGRPNTLPDHVKLWMGNSRGRWEGNTLVVEVTNLNGKQWLDSYANFYSDTVRIVERWTLVKTARAGGRERVAIDWEATIDDPRVYTQPWKMNLPITRQEDPEEMWEHACYEGITSANTAREMWGLGFRWFWGVVPPGAAR